MRSADPRVALCVAVLACMLAPTAPALDLAGPPVTASLWAEQDGVAPGQPFTLALRLSHAAGWHSYWQVAGDSGLPTEVSWRLPPGFRAGELQWPSPHRLPIGALIDYGYEGEALLLTQIEPAAGLTPGSVVRIDAHTRWLMCRDVCIPASADLELTLPVREAAAVRPSDHAPAFGRARLRVPRPLQLAQASATRSGTRVRLSFSVPHALHELQFFPLEAGRIEPSAPQGLHMAGQTAQLDLVAAAPVQAGFVWLRGVLVADGGADSAGGWIGIIEVPLQDRGSEP